MRFTDEFMRDRPSFPKSPAVMASRKSSRTREIPVPGYKLCSRVPRLLILDKG